MRRFDRLLSEALKWSVGDYPEYVFMCGEIPFDYIKDRDYLVGPMKAIEPDVEEFDPVEGPFPDEDKFSNTYDAVGIFSPKKECYFFSYRTTAPGETAWPTGTWDVFVYHMIVSVWRELYGRLPKPSNQYQFNSELSAALYDWGMDTGADTISADKIREIIASISPKYITEALDIGGPVPDEDLFGDAYGIYCVVFEGVPYIGGDRLKEMVKEYFEQWMHVRRVRIEVISTDRGPGAFTPEELPEKSMPWVCTVSGYLFDDTVGEDRVAKLADNVVLVINAIKEVPWW